MERGVGAASEKEGGWGEGSWQIETGLCGLIEWQVLTSSPIHTGRIHWVWVG